MSELSPKQERFCQCIVSGMTGKDSYITAYDTDCSDNTAYTEAYKLLQRDDIKARIEELRIPIVKQVQNTAISERDKKRSICWSEIERCIAERDSNGAARWMDILNKMDSEYININRTIQDDQTAISNLDTNTLRLIANDK